jgi:NAD(P)-dependent dehydrogenase (short-subunit alcohol dehydrogenase family)
VIEFALDRFGRIDALIHNAGLVVFANLEETDEALWRRMTAIGIDAPLRLARAAAPHMAWRGYGRIVLTTSGRALQVEDCVPGLTAYATAKMAQVGLMVGLAAELGDAGVRCNAVSPVAATRVLRRSAPQLRPDLVAPGVAFLASAACTVSGVILRAAGGRFSLARWGERREIDFGSEPASPADIAARWDEIAGTMPP